MLGERDRKEVGVDGIDEEVKEMLDGYDSLNFVGASEGDEPLEAEVEVVLEVDVVGCPI